MDGIWEPLAELELNFHRNKNPVYCLCSRAFIRFDLYAGNKAEADNWCEIKDSDKFEEDSSESVKPVQDQDEPLLENPITKKQEAEIVSCYCSASHYSTDDYESVMQSTSEQCQNNTSKEQPALYILQNSDSGADLSENFIDKPCKINDDSQVNIEINDAISKSKLDIAWEKYWSRNGENIIWKSWIEKYGAYINPSYLEQNSLNEIFDMEIDEACRQDIIENGQTQNVDNANESLVVEIEEDCEQIPPHTKKCFPTGNSEKIPDLKISSYSGRSSVLEGGEDVNTNVNNFEIDSEDNLLKSNSFGSCDTYEKDKLFSAEDEQMKIYEHERVRSRCSNTNLSVKSIANTTITTDSMTNVTKITLSSLDLSCECESVRGSSLSSVCSDDSSEITSSSSSSSKEEMCTEADAWWRKLWKEHYEEQYSSSYKIFSEDFNEKNQLNNEGDIPLEKIANYVEPLKSVCKKTFNKPRKTEKKRSEQKKGGIFDSQLYLNSTSHVLTRLEKTNLFSDNENSQEVNSLGNNVAETENEESHVDCDSITHSHQPQERQCGNIKSNLALSEEEVEDSEDDLDFFENKLPKRLSQRRSYQREWLDRESRPGRKLETIKQALSLMGYSYRLNSDILKSGYVTYRKKNIRGQNRRLKFYDMKPPTHIFFDDDGNELCESKNSESLDTPESPEEEVSSKAEGEEINRLKHCFMEKESLGYEAHSSSVDEEIKIIDESKKQKKKRKRLRKYNNIPFEVEENKNLMKYWIKRYQLFSLFDSGVKLDAESWYSVTPEKVAMHHAERCRCDIIIDAFCGAGGNSIQFAFTCERVIAIDIDPEKIRLAKHNARVYGVEDRIEFIVGDFTKLAFHLQADVVFLSPPWGGPEYSNVDVYNLENILPPLGGRKLFGLATNITPEVAYFLPKNVNSTELAILPGPGGQVEIEQNFLGRKLTSVTAYFGELLRDPDDIFLETG